MHVSPITSKALPGQANCCWMPVSADTLMYFEEAVGILASSAAGAERTSARKNRDPEAAEATGPIDS
jgi:hypothetical protein